jgi:precorrin-2 dehydrogenase/sirohydrochlorin ferrochelatase
LGATELRDIGAHGVFMSYYPILVDLKDKKVVVVGGGTVAQRKIDTLLECGADVYIISREMTPELQKRLEEGKIRLLGRRFIKGYLQGAFLVIASTDDSKFNRRVSVVAREMGILVNVVDQPADSDFIVPSVIKRGDLLIAVSTSGKSPAMAKSIRERLSRQFGSEYEEFLLMMGHLRKEILSRGLSQEDNSRIFHELVDSPILESICMKDWKEVASSLERILEMRISPEDVLNYIKVE